MTSSAPKSLASSTYSADVTQEDLDSAADEVTIGLDDAERARIEQSVAVVNAVYGAPARLAILALRPNWYSDDLGKGRVKVVYSGTPAAAHPVSRPEPAAASMPGRWRRSYGRMGREPASG